VRGARGVDGDVQADVRRAAAEESRVEQASAGAELDDDGVLRIAPGRGDLVLRPERRRAREAGEEEVAGAVPRHLDDFVLSGAA
jgi:hypothetical protein